MRFAIDRAGLVGADGATHAGSFDIAFLTNLPGMVVMAAADEAAGEKKPQQWNKSSGYCQWHLRNKNRKRKYPCFDKGFKTAFFFPILHLFSFFL